MLWGATMERRRTAKLEVRWPGKREASRRPEHAEPIRFNNNRELKGVLDWVDVQDDDSHNTRDEVLSEPAGGVADSRRSTNFFPMRTAAD